ncbi:MAG: hypothetical protein V3S01_06790 [Dehalococcoidia bacterium]
MNWYKISRTSKYHAEGAAWLREGIALCGRRLGSTGWVVPHIWRLPGTTCKDCERVVARKQREG